MKKLIIASLFTSVAMAGSAFAQTTTPGATEPAMEAPAATTMPADGAAMGMANEGGFITYQEGSQLLGSGLMGADVQGPDGESIGTVDDLLLDREGQIQAVVIGVGGFLGIGTKDVAIANDQLEFVLAQDTAAGDAATTTGSAMTPAAPAGGAAAPAGGTAPATGAMTTGTGTDTGMTTGAEAGNYGWSGAGIDHISVAYTREQLEEAPEFEAAE